jgi:hypothetical protein
MFVVCGHSFGLATGDPFREGAHVRKGGCAVLKKKRIVVAFTAMVLTSLLVSLLVGGTAMAATKTYTDRVQGVEVSAGQIDEATNTRVGVTFVGEANGPFPGVMYASLNYTPSRPVLDGGVNTIVGGRWVLKGQKGVLYGTFTGGTVSWNADGTVAEVDADLAIRGGSVKGEPVTGGTGTFEGTLSHLTFPPTVQGTLTLTPS